LGCRNCGDPIDPRRVALGYDYCLKAACQARCLKPVVLAAVGVNKAADYYMKAEEVVPPPPPTIVLSSDDDDGPPTGRAGRRRPPAPSAPATRVKTTREQLVDASGALDAALKREYDRFCRGEITARELDRERDRLTSAFNRRVMAENIRYRSLLRPISPSR
jgi:hypothetical protein